MRFRVSGCVLGAALVWCVGAHAQGLELTRAPLHGGNVADLAYDPNTKGLVYAAVAGPGLYVSNDGGLTFEQRPLPGAFRHEPLMVLPSRSDKGLLLVCDPSVDGVLRSEDGGQTLQPVLTTKDLGCTAITEGTAPGTYYATTYDSDTVTLHSSKDSGKTWTPQVMQWSTQSLFDQELKVAALAQLPSGRLVFALADAAPTFTAGQSGRLAYSDDGVTLIDTKTALDAVLTLASTGSQLLSFGDRIGSPDLWGSPDGATWTKNSFAFGSDEYSPYLLLKYVASRDAFLALGNERLLQSTAATYQFNGGMPLGRFFGMARMRSMAADPADASTWLLGTEQAGEGVFRGSMTNPDDWSLATGLESANVDVAYHDAASGYVYAASLKGGRVWIGPSGARSLRAVYRNHDLPYDDNADTLTALAYDHADPKHLVLALVHQQAPTNVAELWEAADATDATAVPTPKPGDFSQGWSKAPDVTNAVSEASIDALFVDGMLRLVAYVPRSGAADPAQYLFRSTDGGKSYAPVALESVEPISFIERDPHDPHGLLVGAGVSEDETNPATQGLFRSTNDGETWTPFGTLPNPRFIAFDPEDAKRFWVASGLHVWQTVDGGSEFTEIDVPRGGSLLGGLAYSAPLERLLIAQAPSVLEREISDSASWTSAVTLRAAPTSLLSDGSGVASDAGLFVTADALGTLGAAGTSGGAAGGGQGGGTSPGRGGAGSGSGGFGGSASGANGQTPSGGAQSDSGGASAGRITTSDSPESSLTSRGCGCRMSPAPSRGAMPLGLALALALFRRRRALSNRDAAPRGLGYAVRTVSATAEILSRRHA